MHEKYKSGVGRGGLLANIYSAFWMELFFFVFQTGNHSK